MTTFTTITKCVKCTLLETYHGYDITREEDKKVNPLTLEPYGRTYVFYAVYDGEWMLESFKTIKEARQYITKLL